jgi:hypothetical protein
MLDKLMQEAQLRALLIEAIPDLTDAEWSWLKGRRRVADCLEDIKRGASNAVNDLIEEVSGLPSRAGQPTDAPRMVEERGPARARERRAARSRMEALSALLAREAAQEPEVLAFRQKVLKGQLIDYTEVEQWIRKQGETDGPASSWLSDLVIPEGTRTDFDGPALTFDPPLVIERLDPRQGDTFGIKSETLAYGTPGKAWTQRVVVHSRGVLDHLRRLSGDLARRYGWQDAQGTIFVLTGKMPLIPTIRTTRSFRGPLSGTSRIVLDIDPTVTAQEVAEAYRQVRREMIRGRARPLSEKHAQLARFSAERPDGEPWAGRMAAWNDENPEWRYGHVSNFTRDVRRAERQLLQPRY